jgi:hypothetical protein
MIELIGIYRPCDEARHSKTVAAVTTGNAKSAATPDIPPILTQRRIIHLKSVV